MTSPPELARDPASVAAVVPAFHPRPDLVDLVAALLAQTPHVVVVDDTGAATGSSSSGGAGSPAGSGLAVLDACRSAGAVVVSHDVNRGIASALTTGVVTARAHWPETEAALTVDQDSRLEPDHLVRLLAAWRSGDAAGLRVGLVGPEHVEGLPSRAAGTREGVVLGAEPVQSGLLVPLEVLDAVGGLDTGLVIDGVDSALYLAVLDAGRHVVVAPGLRVAHRLGTGRPVRLLGRPVVVRGVPLELSVSAPFRSYYLVRNRLVLARRHGRRHPRWAAGQLVGLARHLVLLLLLAPDRGARLTAVGSGIRDALRGRDGLRPR